MRTLPMTLSISVVSFHVLRGSGSRGAEEIVDDVWFYINIVLATVALFASTTTIIAIKTK